MNTLYRAELVYAAGRVLSNAGVLVSEEGEVLRVTSQLDQAAAKIVELRGKAILPGFVNAHSHSFQRLIRGMSESRMVSGNDFWSWRNTMYHAASSLDPQEVYDVARMAFLEMALAGTTTVGEFHYLHSMRNGVAYEDPNLLSKRVIEAAQSVGIRIVLLRCAYMRSGYELPPDPGQMRFYESAREYLDNMEKLIGDYTEGSNYVQFGVAPHSIRAVPLHDLKTISEWGRSHKLPLHMHVAEQTAENMACVREYGITPVELLAKEGLLGRDFTAIHAIHITASEISSLANAGASICCCPTTERNLGDGISAADRVMNAGIPMALGSDSQAQIDPLEDAREIEYHLRLIQQQRAVLDHDTRQTLASRLFACATASGADALALNGGRLAVNSPADFFTVDLNDPSIAGNSVESLLPMIVFSLSRSAIRDVVVNGKFVIRDQMHLMQEEIVARYAEVHRRVWRTAGDGGNF